MPRGVFVDDVKVRSREAIAAAAFANSVPVEGAAPGPLTNSGRHASAELEFALPQRRLPIAQMMAKQCSDFLDQDSHGGLAVVMRL